MRFILVAAAIWAAQGAPARVVLPENPCDLLTIEQVTKASGLKVTAANRVRSRGEDVEARTSSTPVLGSICTYDSPGEYGWISIALQRPPVATPDTYRTARDTYFATYSRSGWAVPGIGQDAWVSGGTMIRVLVRDDLQFWVMTQTCPSGSCNGDGVLIPVAKALVRRLGS